MTINGLAALPFLPFLLARRCNPRKSTWPCALDCHVAPRPMLHAVHLLLYRLETDVLLLVLRPSADPSAILYSPERCQNIIWERALAADFPWFPPAALASAMACDARPKRWSVVGHLVTDLQNGLHVAPRQRNVDEWELHEHDTAYESHAATCRTTKTWTSHVWMPGANDLMVLSRFHGHATVRLVWIGQQSRPGSRKLSTSSSRIVSPSVAYSATTRPPCGYTPRSLFYKRVAWARGLLRCGTKTDDMGPGI
ncbi:hypothetical protein CERZMDRAFT_85886 [Cercospora zeae-maydis SCOH1-5]|uniref:Uncharacterized protein n=1 Tax=Cercospora zeae-maydis SCOH1-5 TaxID=717836 RepID=A0A6A6FAV1_9PEZI|nr:hypothetical protein CERZMDRAFT_85886 [Cercospora zeae-maydis SCOH1-5]